VKNARGIVAALQAINTRAGRCAAFPRPASSRVPRPFHQTIAYRRRSVRLSYGGRLSLVDAYIVWGWQVATWTGLMKRFGITTFVLGKNFSWEQFYVMIDWPDMAVLSVLLFFLTWMVFRSPRLIPTVKGAYAVLVIPIFLYSLVVFLRNAPPAGPLGHIGPEWLYGELVLWCLVPLLYAVFVFPVPFSLSAKLSSLLIVLLMSIAWRTMAPVVYIMIAIGSQGLLSISAWMALGPWADYLYIIPVFAATLALYRGGRSDDYRA